MTDKEVMQQALELSLAQPVQPADKPTPWHHRILNKHPKSEPEFWPDELRLKYMSDELYEYRLNWAQPVHKTQNFAMTESHIELLATMLHCVPTGESELFKDLNDFCRSARNAVNKSAIAQPKDKL